MDPLQFLEDRLLDVASYVIPSPSPMLTRMGLEAFRNAAGRDVATEPPIGQAATLRGKPVYYTGKDYSYQSPESYKKLIGKYPAGYTPPKPEQKKDDQAEATDSADTGTGAKAPDGGPKLDGEGPEQTQEPITDKAFETIEELMSLPYQEGLSKLRTRNLIEAATVMSALRAPRERQKQAAEIERENIKAWRDLRTAQIEANARQQMALGLATVSAMTPNLSNFAEIYKASTAPFNIRPRE